MKIPEKNVIKLEKLSKIGFEIGIRAGILYTIVLGADFY